MSKRFFRNPYASASIGITVIGLTLVLGGAAVGQKLPVGTGSGQGPPPRRLPVATNPGATKPPPPAPVSARGTQCRRMADELGLVDVRRTRYIVACTQR